MPEIQNNVFTSALQAAQEDLLKYLEAACFLVVSHDGYWGRGKTIKEAVQNCLKQGTRRSQSASVLLVLGDSTPEINEVGYIIREGGSHMITVVEGIKLGSLIPENRKRR